MDLLQGKAKTAFAPLASRLAKLLAPKILSMVQKAGVVDAAGKSEELATMLFVSGIMPELESLTSELTKIFVEGAFTLSELIAIGVFKALCELRGGQIHAAFSRRNTRICGASNGFECC